MPFKIFPAGIYFPEILNINAVFVALLIDAAGEKVAFVVTVPKTGTVDKLCFKTGGISSSQALRVSVQTVNTATGEPTGTLYGGSSAGVQASPSANTFYTVALGTGATAVKGDRVAVVIEFDSTIGSVYIDFPDSDTQIGYPYVMGYTTSWAKYGYSPCTALEYSDGSYEPMMCYPCSSLGAIVINTGSSPDEAALKISAPFSTRCVGFWVFLDGNNPVDIILYDKDDNVLQSRSLDQDVRSSTSVRLIQDYFVTSQILKPEEVYRLAIKPTTASNIVIPFFIISTAAIMDSFSGGARVTVSTRENAGAWTDFARQRLFGGLILDATGSKMLTHPGMSGGFSG
jgi:hypothetical protein